MAKRALTPQRTDPAQRRPAQSGLEALVDMVYDYAQSKGIAVILPSTDDPTPDPARLLLIPGMTISAIPHPITAESDRPRLRLVSGLSPETPTEDETAA